ncbi:hypothetical protein Tco_1020723, partial [Tanacetum coccineum]
RRDLQLADEEGVDCLLNSTIFEQLTLMSQKTTAWNEFSSTMASAIICLDTNQKFSFLEFIFESMIRNLDNLSGKFLMYPRKPKRKDTQVPQPSDPIENVADEVVHKELGDSLVRAVTTASSLEGEKDSGNINKTQSKAIPNESSSQGTNSGNTLQSDEDRLKLDELMKLCTTLQNWVLDLEKTKTTQHNEIASLKRRVKKLEKKARSRTHRLKRLYKVGLTGRVESYDNEEILGEDASKQGRINAIDADEEITLVSVPDVNVSTGKEVFATTIDDITLAQVLEEMKSTKPKKKGVVIQELGESTTTISSQLSSQQSQDKAKEKAKKEEEANIALIETWDDIQAKIDVDHQLAERMQAQEQEELSIEEKATLFQQLLEKRRKHFAAKRAEEKRNKPPTKAQQRKIMCTYLKNMEGYKLKDLKLKEFDSIQEMFDRAFKRVNTFEDFRTELVEGKEKRAGTELIQEITKKQKVEDDKETAELKQLMKIIPDEEITLVSVHDVNVSAGEEVFATTVDDITLAQVLEEMKSTKPKKKGVVIQELGESTTTISSQLSSQQSQDKGKGILIEPVKPMNKKDLIRLDEETALNLQAEFDEEERLAREKAEKEEEANIALIETWDDIQAKIDADHQLAERMQAQEQEELSIEEKATLFQQLLEKRRKHFAAKRAEEKRNKPPTKAQQRKIMCTYLKNMEGYKLKDLKLKEFDSIQDMFDKAFKRVNIFEDFRIELVEGKKKRAGTKLIQEIIKKQKVEDDKETTELKQLMKIIPDEDEVAIDAIPLAVNQMLKSFGREDLEDLYKLVKVKYESTRPVEYMDLLLWGDLKTMFKPHVEDKVWRNQQEYKVLNWKLYESCGVHSLTMQHVQIYMLVEKKYPLAPLTLSMMLEKKLMIDYESEMAYQLFKFIIKQLKK